MEGLDYLRNRKQGYDTQSKIAKGVAREHKKSNEMNKTCRFVRCREKVVTRSSIVVSTAFGRPLYGARNENGIERER
jgi:hypothetical protein